MRKKLAIFCDGTWNDLRMTSPTNVARLAKCVASDAADGTPQIVYYDDGVGVASGISVLTDELVKIWGGAFGRGLDQKIEAAYRFLVANYEEGDDIYIFGFSRGAYTARSLCGLIRKCGILKRSFFDKTPDAMALYRNGQNPHNADMVDFRAAYSHEQAAGEEDHSTAWNFEKGQPGRSRRQLRRTLSISSRRDLPDNVSGRVGHCRLDGNS